MEEEDLQQFTEEDLRELLSTNARINLWEVEELFCFRKSTQDAPGFDRSLFVFCFPFVAHISEPRLLHRKFCLRGSVFDS